MTFTRSVFLRPILVICLLTCVAHAKEPVHEPVILVENGKAQATIVLADDPGEVAKEAAEVLQHNIGLMMQTLPVYRHQGVFSIE